MPNRPEKRGLSLVFEAHEWRGFAYVGGPLLAVVNLGFISVGGCPFVITERLRRVKAAIANALYSQPALSSPGAAPQAGSDAAPPGAFSSPAQE